MIDFCKVVAVVAGAVLASWNKKKRSIEEIDRSLVKNIQAPVIPAATSLRRTAWRSSQQERTAAALLRSPIFADRSSWRAASR
jgi:hypothetical protein